MDDSASMSSSQPGVIRLFFRRIGEIQQNLLDKATPHIALRWGSTMVLALLYCIRVYILQGWYIVTYALGIYLLNLFIAFLTPKVNPALIDDDEDEEMNSYNTYVLAAFILYNRLTWGWYIVTYALGIYLLNLFLAFLTPKVDPASYDDDNEDGPSLPTKSNEEFRPFMRRLPEFKFWYSTAKAVTIAMICTFFDALNIPVFWPILVMYFIILFVITMKRQIKHMIKYRYLPFSHGKKKYQGKEDTGAVVSS